MTRHLKACWDQHAIALAGKNAPGRWFHLVVEGRYSPEYWLHLQASAKSTFGDLDRMLRALWLECCGHLSAFEFPVKRTAPRRGGGLDVFALMAAARDMQQAAWDEPDDDQLMDEPLGSKLAPGMVFNHQYDFGSTTELVLRVADEHEAPAMTGKNLKLLARNETPSIPCSLCGKPATQLCQECTGEGEAGGLCDACASKHECEEEMLVPLVNSPRAGVCGYCGPSVEP